MHNTCKLCKTLVIIYKIKTYMLYLYNLSFESTYVYIWVLKVLIYLPGSLVKLLPFLSFEYSPRHCHSFCALMVEMSSSHPVNIYWLCTIDLYFTKHLSHYREFGILIPASAPLPVPTFLFFFLPKSREEKRRRAFVREESQKGWAREVTRSEVSILAILNIQLIVAHHHYPTVL
jgi:hypothetical protein